jgi:hypothetical protein
MSSKSKRNRRNISPNKVITTSAAPDSEKVSPVSNVQNAVMSNNNSIKSGAVANTANANFTRDLKWLALVTLIMIICVVLAYIFFH